jgi:hypothetical protein
MHSAMTLPGNVVKQVRLNGAEVEQKRRDVVGQKVKGDER